MKNRAYAVSQLSDLHQKLSKAQSSVQTTRAQAPTSSVVEETKTAGKGKEEKKKADDNQLAKSVKDSAKITAEAQHGLIAQVIKDVIFSRRLNAEPEGTTAPVGEVIDATMSG